MVSLFASAYRHVSFSEKRDQDILIQQIVTETKEKMLLDNSSPKSVNLEFIGKINQDETQTYKNINVTDTIESIVSNVT